MLDVMLSDAILKSKTQGAADHNVKDSEAEQHKVIVRIHFL